MLLKIFLGDVVRMRRAHPCGENRWEIIRVGMEVRLRCLRCSRSLLMPRPEFEKQVKEFVAPRASRQIEQQGATPAQTQPE